MAIYDFDVETLPIDEVFAIGKRRAVNEQAVTDLVASIEQIGLQTPISVRGDNHAVNPDTGEATGGFVLISGRHRVEAFKRLGRDRIPARVWHQDSDPALVEMWEISENLHRAELTVQERAEHVARWIVLAERKVTEVLLPQLVAKPNGRPESGVRAASRDLGIGREEARRAIKIASLSDEAKETARDLRLDNNQSALLAAAKKETPPEQVAVLQQKAAAEAKPKPKPKRGGRQQPAVRQDPTVQMAFDIIEFLCRVPADKYTPAEATEITDPTMVAAIDRYFERANPWIANFADCWRERGGDEVDPSGGAAADMISGIVGHIWAAKHARPEMPVSEIKAALNYIFKLIGRGPFGADNRS